MVLLVIMLEANYADSGLTFLLSTMKKNFGKIRIIIDLGYEMNRRRFPVIDWGKGPFGAQF